MPAIKHLIKNSNCNHLIFSSNSKQLKELAITAEKELRDNDHPLTLMEMLTYNEIFNDDDDNNDYTSIINSLPQLSKERRDLNSSALIIHSSGSTSFPKVIVQTNKNLIQWSRIPFYGSSDVCDKTLFVGALPTFHAVCLCVLFKKFSFFNLFIDGYRISNHNAFSYRFKSCIF